MRIGIDFGTSFCTMSRLNGDGKPEAIRDADGLDKIPSVVYWGMDGVKVGQAAVDIFSDSDALPDAERFDVRARTFKSVKREFFPDRNKLLPDGKVIHVADIATEILKYLKIQAERRAFDGKTVDSVCLTHPVSFSVAQRELLKKAAINAGFVNVELMEEPVAAALGYAVFAGKAMGSNILVYDLGGGTLDIALVRREADGEYRIPVAPLGDASCGGDDFDKMLYDYFEMCLKKQGQSAFNDNPDEWDLKTLFECRKFKETLSRRESGVFRVFSEKINLIEKLSRNDFNLIIRDKVKNSASLLETMVRKASEANYPVDTVILIGGSSRIPLVRELLGSKLPVAPLETMTDDTAVAMGAAIDLEAIKQKRKEEAAQAKERKESERRKAEFEREKTLKESEELKARAERQAQELRLEREKLEREKQLLREQNKSTQIKDSDALFSQAKTLFDGNGQNQNYAEALILFRQAADLGNIEAFFYLGKMFYDGDGVSINYIEAHKWYLKAAEKGHAEAQYKLAIMYLNGTGCRTSFSDAHRWYQAAGTQGHLEAIFETGYDFLAARGIKRSPREAVEWFRKAANRGHANAQYYLGTCYRDGIGVSVDTAQSVRLFEKAAIQGHVRAGAATGIKKLKDWWSSL